MISANDKSNVTYVNTVHCMLAPGKYNLHFVKNNVSVITCNQLQPGNYINLSPNLHDVEIILQAHLWNKALVTSLKKKAFTKMLCWTFFVNCWYLKNIVIFLTMNHICLKSVQSSELSEQTTKIAKLIRQLKQQERAYVELLERSLVSRPLL